MIYITLHKDGMPVIVNVEHVDWLTEYKGYTEVSFYGADNTLAVDETSGQILSLIREVFEGIKGVEVLEG